MLHEYTGKQDGKIIISKTFTVRRGVIQGDVEPSAVYTGTGPTNLTRGQTGQGVKVGTINELLVLGYADDLATIGPDIERMTARLAKFADASKALADMELKLPKTF